MFLFRAVKQTASTRMVMFCFVKQNTSESADVSKQTKQTGPNAPRNTPPQRTLVKYGKVGLSAPQGPLKEGWIFLLHICTHFRLNKGRLLRTIDYRGDSLLCALSILVQLNIRNTKKEEERGR